MKLLIRAAVALAMSCYTLMLIYWMFVGFGREHRPDGELLYNLTPLSTIKNYFIYFDHYKFNTWLVNIGGNILVFVPFGISFPIIFRWRFGKTMLNFITFICVLEVMQMVTRRGSLDIDDVILNSIGAFLGYVLYKMFASPLGITADSGRKRKA
ncbi:VanZ family protein [Paenibacillus sp. NEAU-GSW1]|uniref:VanZ family protein n=1 Tax=Paenibacillus sp. NEAU-GSW1 TaxID=2682486 RepID=UPI0012E20F9F|nr:VanZ family protein [Paenibacillus sp. NEAU-GSW1]MUT66624.1 VanZ family protein [Paenibacillus sp. NEAU-GSW1]